MKPYKSGTFALHHGLNSSELPCTHMFKYPYAWKAKNGRNMKMERKAAATRASTTNWPIKERRLIR